MAFTKRLSEGEKRGIAEQLTEEELVIFDLLTKPDMKLTKAEEIEVKKVARELLETLKREKRARLEEAANVLVRHAATSTATSHDPRRHPWFSAPRTFQVPGGMYVRPSGVLLRTAYGLLRTTTVAFGQSVSLGSL
jgi:hypothetical protein